MAGPIAGRVLDFAGGLGVSSPSVIVDSNYQFLGYLANTTAFADTVDTALPLDTEIYKAGITHSTVTNNSRVTITKAGMYGIYTRLVIANNASNVGDVLATLYLNGSAHRYLASVQLTFAQTQVLVAYTQQSLAVNDYVELFILCDGTALNRNIYGIDARLGSYFGVYLLSGQS